MKAPQLYVKKFYDSLNEDKICGVKCNVCGCYEFPPVYSCNECGNHDMEWVEMSGEAEVIEMSIPTGMLRAPADEEFWPYALGVIRTKEGPEMRTMIRGITADNQDKIRANMPYPCKAELVQRDGWKRLVYRVEA